MVTTDNGANIDFMDTDESITPQHYAFLVSKSEFDEIFGRIRDRKLTYWADPGQTKANEINRHDGGRGVYFEDPDGTFWRSSRDRMAAAAGTRELFRPGHGPAAGCVAELRTASPIHPIRSARAPTRRDARFSDSISNPKVVVFFGSSDRAGRRWSPLRPFSAKSEHREGRTDSMNEFTAASCGKDA